MLYRIGEFATLSGVSTKTLRHYDRMGLLRPAAVDARTRYRCYAIAQLRELSSILALRDLGLSLPEIRTFTSRIGSRADRRAFLLRLRQSTRETIEKATQSLNSIDAALDQEIEQPGAWMHAVPVVMKRGRALRVASLRAEMSNYIEADVLRLERELIGALPSGSLGPTRGVLWQRCADSGSLIAEPFVEIRGDVPRRSFYDVKELPSVMTACAFSGNDDAAADQAYRAINMWMSTRGFSLAGPKREIYLAGMLEIQFPLRSETSSPQRASAG
ncbi:MAG: MerR family transcriptional regulator [Steroidobacteraceae bacterium]